jgi:pyruvate carboxylase subunit B
VTDAPREEGLGEVPEPAPPAPLTETRELLVEVEGEQYNVRVTAPLGSFGGGGGGAGAALTPNGATPGRPAVVEGTIVAPMQGLILRVPVSIGDTVAMGDVVAVLEAMKMQNDVTATRAGTVKEVYVSEGTVVGPKDPLLLVE